MLFSSYLFLICACLCFREIKWDAGTVKSWSAVVKSPNNITGRMQVPSTEQTAVLSEKAKNPLYGICTAPHSGLG